MTESLATLPAPTNHEILRQAQLAWFRCGVRRRDRRLLREELLAELSAAEQQASAADLFGPDPRATAAAWAREKRLADRRLRLAALLLPVLVAGTVGSGAVLAFLADAFAGDGRTALGSPGIVLILGLYAGSAVLSVAAMLATTLLILRAYNDGTARLTVRVLAAALPAGGLVAAVVGVAVARAQHFTTEPRTFVEVTIGVLATLAVTVVTARATAIRLYFRRDAARSPRI